MTSFSQLGSRFSPRDSPKPKSWCWSSCRAGQGATAGVRTLPARWLSPLQTVGLLRDGAAHLWPTQGRILHQVTKQQPPMVLSTTGKAGGRTPAGGAERGACLLCSKGPALLAFMSLPCFQTRCRANQPLPNALLTRSTTRWRSRLNAGAGASAPRSSSTRPAAARHRRGMTGMGGTLPGTPPHCRAMHSPAQQRLGTPTP